jgi:hypothetical protein
MGGCAAYLLFARLPQFQAAVPMIGIPAVSARWLDLLAETAYSNPAWAAALTSLKAQTAAHTAFIQALDPSPHLQPAAPRALFLMNNDFDSDQPKHYAVRCYADLLPAYAATPDKLRLAIYPAGHVVTPAMERDAVAWLDRHLNPG